MNEFIDDRYPHPRPPCAEVDAAPQPMPWWLLALISSAIAAWAVFAVAVYVFGRMIQSAIALGWPV